MKQEEMIPAFSLSANRNIASSRFNPTEKRTEITYRTLSDGSVHRISKGMSHAILDLCTRDKTTEQIRQLNADVDEFATRGLRALAVAIEDVPSGEKDGEGNGFKLVGLLPIYDPPRSDTKETIERAMELGRLVFCVPSR